MLCVSFAAGVLLATAFLEMFPEAVERRQNDGNFFIATLGAIGGFFLLERFLSASTPTTTRMPPPGRQATSC